MHSVQRDGRTDGQTPDCRRNAALLYHALSVTHTHTHTHTHKFDRGLSHHSAAHAPSCTGWKFLREYSTISSVELCIDVCMQSTAPAYLMECYTPISDISCRLHCGPPAIHQLFVLRHRHSMFGRRAFSVPDPMAWNSL